MSTWNDLSMRERAAFMNTAVKNGYRDIESIKRVYNEFAGGGNLFAEKGKMDNAVKPAVGGFKMFTPGFADMSTKEAPTVAAAPDAVKIKQKVVMPNNYYNITANKDVNDSFSQNKNYNEGSLVKDRLATMYAKQSDADEKLKTMQRLDRGYASNPSQHVFFNQKNGSQINVTDHKIYMDNRIPWSNTLFPMFSTYGHEMDHDYFPNVDEEAKKFSPEYLSHFNTFGYNKDGEFVGPQKSLMINKGLPEVVPKTSYELEWNHDNRRNEKLPFIKEVQKDMGRAINPATGKPYWDYTSGDKLDAATYREYLKANPRARTQYWEDEDAIWLLNNTASINNGPARNSLFSSDIPIDNPQDNYVTYAAYGGGLNSPFSHHPIPAVRYAGGGHLSKHGGTTPDVLPSQPLTDADNRFLSRQNLSSVGISGSSSDIMDSKDSMFRSSTTSDYGNGYSVRNTIFNNNGNEGELTTFNLPSGNTYYSQTNNGRHYEGYTPPTQYAEGGNLFLEGGPEGFWDKLDEYAEESELPLAGANAASWLATMAAPNPVTPVVAYGTSLLGAGVDAYQATRAAIKGDYKTASQNVGEFGLGLIGATGAKAAAKAAKAASKVAKATKTGKQVSTALTKATSVPVRADSNFGKYLKWQDKGFSAIYEPRKYSVLSQIGNDYYTAGKEGVKLYKQGKLK